MELRRSLSTPRRELVQRGEIDSALVTRMPGVSDGEVVRQEPLIPVAGESHDLRLQKPVPLSLLPPGHIDRDHAIEGLERAGARLRQIGVHEYVPPLPKVDLLLDRASGPATAAACTLHDDLARCLSGKEAMPARVRGGIAPRRRLAPAAESAEGPVAPAAPGVRPAA